MTKAKLTAEQAWHKAVEDGAIASIHEAWATKAHQEPFEAIAEQAFYLGWKACEGPPTKIPYRYQDFISWFGTQNSAVTQADVNEKLGAKVNLHECVAYAMSRGFHIKQVSQGKYKMLDQHMFDVTPETERTRSLSELLIAGLKEIDGGEYRTQLTWEKWVVLWERKEVAGEKFYRVDLWYFGNPKDETEFTDAKEFPWYSNPERCIKEAREWAKKHKLS